MANRTVVPGKNVVLKVWKEDGYVPVPCLIDVSIWLTEEYDDTSTPDSGRYVTRAPSGKAEWGVDIESVTVLDDPSDVLFFTWEFFLELVRSNGVDIELTLTDTLGGTKVYRGFVYMPNNRISGTAGDVSRSTHQLIGSAGIDFSGSVTPQRFHDMRIDFPLTVEGQTEVQDDELIGKAVADILYVHREGEDKYRVTLVAPTAKTVQLDPVDGKIIFNTPSDANMVVYCIIRI